MTGFQPSKVMQNFATIHSSSVSLSPFLMLRIEDGKTVKLFDLRQWLMKEKVRPPSPSFNGSLFFSAGHKAPTTDPFFQPCYNTGGFLK